MGDRFVNEPAGKIEKTNEPAPPFAVILLILPLLLPLQVALVTDRLVKKGAFGMVMVCKLVVVQE